MRRKPSGLLILFFVVFTELIGFGLIIPVLPQLAKSYQLSHFSIGILMSAYSFAQFFAAPVLGVLSDKYGRRPILILSKCGTVISYIMLAYASSYTAFLVARLLDGFTGGNIAVARAYVADVTDAKNRAKGMAVIGISFGLGFIVGPAIGGLLHNDVSGQWVTSLVAASLSFIAALLTWGCLKEPIRKPQKKRQLGAMLMGIRSPLIVSVLGVYFCYMLVFSGFETTLSMFTDYLFSFSTKENSWLFMYAGLVGLVVQGALSRRATTHSAFWASIGLVILAVGFIGLALSTNLSVLLGALALFAIGYSLVNTYLPSLLTSCTAASSQGLVMGAYEGVGSVSRIVGPLIAYSIAYTLIRTEYLLFGVVVAILSLIVRIVFSKNKGL